MCLHANNSFFEQKTTPISNIWIPPSELYMYNNCTWTCVMSMQSAANDIPLLLLAPTTISRKYWPSIVSEHIGPQISPLQIVHVHVHVSTYNNPLLIQNNIFRTYCTSNISIQISDFATKMSSNDSRARRSQKIAAVKRIPHPMIYPRNINSEYYRPKILALQISPLQIVHPHVSANFFLAANFFVRLIFFGCHISFGRQLFFWRQIFSIASFFLIARIFRPPDFFVRQIFF